MAIPRPDQPWPFTAEQMREWLSRPLPMGTFGSFPPILKPLAPKDNLVFRFPWAKDAT